MSGVTLRFHGALNDFLSPARRDTAFLHSLSTPSSVKDLLESLGPPHPEVSHVLADEAPVALTERVRPGQRLDIHPWAPSQAPLPPGEPRFLLDVGLGRLAGFLRMLGFDTDWRNDFADDVLARRSHDERRILLTRDLGVLKRSEVEYGAFPRETHPERQLVEVARRYALVSRMRPFTRCITCNAPLADATPAEVTGHVPERVLATYTRFLRCTGCAHVYWAGSHHARMSAVIDTLRAAAPA
jgi:uncharacterized protein